MKQFIRIYISMALFVLLGMSAFAGGKVEVADDVSNGTITGQVNGTIVTLTVTPDPGYYIRKTDLVAEKTFMPLARSKRAVPLADQLEIVGDDPEDLSQQRTYTVTLPSEEYDVLVHANFQARGGKAEVNDAIRNGTVVASVDQLTLTVTVTPADGYYFKKENLRVDKTYMPRSSRATTPIPDELEIIGDDPADLSKPRTYTVTLPGWEYDAWVDATFMPRTPLTSAQVKLSASSFVYNGNDQKPTVTLAGLTEGRDYTLTFAESEWKNVGTYSLSVKGESTYKGTITKSFTITKAMPVVTAPVANNLTFNREAQILAQAGSAEGGEIQYSLEKDGTYTTTVPSVTNAGTYTFYYRVIGDSNHQDVAAKPVSVTVAPKVVSNAAIVLSQQSYVYDGTEKEPVATVKDGEVVIPSSEYTVTYASNVNAGTAGVTVTDKENGNYTVSGQTTFVIEKAPAQIIIAPQSLTLSYNGEVQALVDAGEAVGGEIKYAQAEAGPFTTIIPMATNVGSYTVYYKVVGDANHYDSDVFSVDVSIVPKVVNSPTILLSQQSYVYDGTEKEPTVIVKDEEVVIASSEYTVSYTSNVNVGEATVVITDNEGGNYTVSGQTTFTIENAVAEVATIPQALMLTYNGEAQALVENGVAVGGEMQYALAEAGPFTTDLPTATSVGSYTVYYKVVGDANHNDSEIGSVTVTIAPKVVDAPVIVLSQTSFAYDGTAKEPTVTVKDGETVIASSEYTVSYASNVNVGDATVVITDNEGGNYTVSGQTTFTITKGESQIIIAPQPLTLTYNGEAHALITAGEAANGEMQYALAEVGPFTADIPTATDAGLYTVYYKVAGDANHNDSEVGSVTVAIAPKVVDAPIIVLSQTSFAYDGTDKEPTVTVKDGEIVIASSEYIVSYASNVNVGDATVVITDNEGGNYTVSGQTTFTIEHAVAEVATIPQALMLTYNGEAQTMVENGVAVGGEMQYALAESGPFTADIPAATDAGSYVVYYKVVGDANHNDSEVGSVTVTIAPKVVDAPVIVLSQTSFAYDGIAKEPTVTVKDGESIIPESEYSISYSSNVNVGTAEVTIIDNDSGNYTVSGQTTFTITEGDVLISIAPQPLTLTYNGEAQTLVTAGEAANGEMQYALAESGPFTADIPVATDAGLYTVYYKVVGDSNHNDSEIGNVTVTIAPMVVDAPVFVLSQTSFAYDGTAKEPTVTVKDGETVIASSEYTVSYTSNVNVGDAEVTITDNEGGNYTVSGQTTFTITKGDALITTTPQPLALTYSGEAQVLVTAGEAANGEMQYALAEEDPFIADIPEATTVGSYTVYYKVVGDANHNDSEIGSVTVTIAPKVVDAPVIELSQMSFAYDGTAKEPDVTVKDGETVIPESEYTISYSSNVNVGEAIVTITDNEGGNYTVSGQTTFTITEGDVLISIAPQPLTLTYSGEAQALVTAGEAAIGEMQYALAETGPFTNDVPTATDAGSYTVYYKAAGDANHNDSEVGSVIATIAPKVVDAPIIVLSQTSFAYDGTDKEPTVTVKDGEIVIASSEYIVSYASNVNVGDATVVITDNEGGNYTVSGQTTFTIEHAVAEVATIPQALMLTYNGEAQTMVENGVAVGGEMQYALAESGPFTADIPAATDAGSYVVYYKVVGDANHNDSEVGSVNVTIAPKVVDAPVIELSQSSFAYDGTAKEPDVTVKDGDVVILSSEYTVSYASNVNAGTATVTITDSEGGNYTVSGQTTFTITKGEAQITTAPQALTLTYNGEAQTLVAAGEATNGEMHYALAEAGPFTIDLPTATNAGSYTVYYKVVGDANHNDSEVGSVVVAIAPKVVDAPVIELSQSSFAYDGTAKEPDVAVKDGDVVIPSSEYAVSYASNVNAGEATVAITDNVGGNYTVSGQTTFTIMKASSAITMAPQPLVLGYTGEPQALIVAGEAEGGTLVYSLDGTDYQPTIPTGVDAKTYTVYYKVQADGNHTDSESSSVSVTIGPKTLLLPTILIGTTVYTYDGTAKEPEVTVQDGDAVIDSSEYTVSYASNVSAGEAVVVITDNEGGNYTVSGQAAFTIAKAPLSAIADNVMMKKGDPMPDLTIRYKGFVNDETEAVILKQCVAFCDEITDTIDGIYQIMVSGGEAANYDFVYVNGLLTIFVPVILADEAGNEVGASVITDEDTDHVVIVELTEGMLNGTEDIPAELKDGEGETYQVTEIASEAFEEKPSNVIIELPDGISTTNPVTNVINGDGTCETLDLTDVDGFGIQRTLEVEEVVYEREVDSDVLTVCLPYSTEIPEDVTVYELDATAGEGVSFVPVTGNTLEAYQPYLMRPNGEALSRRVGTAESPATLNLGAKNVTISPVQEDVVVSAGVFKLCGTVRGLTHAEGLELKAYVMQPDYTWKMTASSALEDANKPYLSAFQAYMQIVGGDGTEVISTEMEGLITVIHDVSNSALDTDGWYDLMGRKLPSKPMKKGLYIYQGRKVKR